MAPELLTVQQFSQALNIGVTRTYALIKNKKITARKLGKKTLIARKDMEEFISNLDLYIPEQDGGAE